jgi:hypothetical protein
MEQQAPCPFCGQFAGYVFVHGHYQCNNCGQNVMPCCEGLGRHFGMLILKNLLNRTAIKSSL